MTSLGYDLRTHPKAPRKRLIASMSLTSPKCLTASRCFSVERRPSRPTISPRNSISGWKILPVDLAAPRENPLAMQMSKNGSNAAQCSNTCGSASGNFFFLHSSSFS